MSLQLRLSSSDATKTSADALAVVVHEGTLDSHPTLQALDEAFGGALGEHLARVEFDGKRLATVEVPTLGCLSTPRLILVGAGPADSADEAVLRDALATAVRATLSQDPHKIAVVLPEGAWGGRTVGEGVCLGAYRFTKYFTGKRRPKRELGSIDIHSIRPVTARDKTELGVGQAIADGVCIARDLVNEPPNVLYPETFARVARDVAKKSRLKIQVLDEKALARAGHALHIAVGQGSTNKPRLIHLTYSPRGAKGRLVFVGKGITFDSGGLCIKPMQGMADMKTDMAGAGAVLGLMAAVAAAAPAVEVHGIIGAAENMPDGNAYRPADVFTSLSGKTVEIINTDAEGRLVLADALTYATRLEPDAIIDAATLTGATLVSLGQPYSAFYSTDEGLAQQMAGAAQVAGESFWRMPLIEELSSQLKSDIADLKHLGDRFGGAITAALFLREFVAQVPWIHCDVPGAVFNDRPSGAYPKGATGHAVMTFLRLAESFAEQSSSRKSKAQPAAKKTAKRRATRTKRR